MRNNLGDFRKSYKKGALEESQLPMDPLLFFDIWFREAANHNSVDEVNAMSLSTHGTDGFPNTRVVLLKDYDFNGFTFYTNFNSSKGRAIINNPKVCLSFFWPGMERQIIIKGDAQKINNDDSLAYFQSRPRGSQIGAHASPQSQVVPNRSYLEEQLTYFEKKFSDGTVPKPEHWGGFLVQAYSIEFWQGRDNRLHDRILFTKDTDGWHRFRLAP